MISDEATTWPLSLPTDHGSPFTTLAFSFPVHDWQFWVATAIFVLAAAWLLRGVLPVPFLSKRRRRLRSQKRATLTIEGKPPER